MPACDIRFHFAYSRTRTLNISKKFMCTVYIKYIKKYGKNDHRILCKQRYDSSWLLLCRHHIFNGECECEWKQKNDICPQFYTRLNPKN